MINAGSTLKAGKPFAINMILLIWIRLISSTFQKLDNLGYHFILTDILYIYFTRNTSCFLECPKGYFGITCDMPCRYPSFGDFCQSRCYCDVDNCNHIMGCNGKPCCSFPSGRKNLFCLVNLPDIVLFVRRKIVSFLSREFTGFCTFCMARIGLFRLVNWPGFNYSLKYCKKKIPANSLHILQHI